MNSGEIRRYTDLNVSDAMKVGNEADIIVAARQYAESGQRQALEALINAVETLKEQQTSKSDESAYLMLMTDLLEILDEMPESEQAPLQQQEQEQQAQSNTPPTPEPGGNKDIEKQKEDYLSRISNIELELRRSVIDHIRAAEKLTKIIGGLQRKWRSWNYELYQKPLLDAIQRVESIIAEYKTNPDKQIQPEWTANFALQKLNDLKETVEDDIQMQTPQQLRAALEGIRKIISTEYKKWTRPDAEAVVNLIKEIEKLIDALDPQSSSAPAAPEAPPTPPSPPATPEAQKPLPEPMIDLQNALAALEPQLANPNFDPRITPVRIMTAMGDVEVTPEFLGELVRDLNDYMSVPNAFPNPTEAVSAKKLLRRADVAIQRIRELSTAVETAEFNSWKEQLLNTDWRNNGSSPTQVRDTLANLNTAAIRNDEVAVQAATQDATDLIVYLLNVDQTLQSAPDTALNRRRREFITQSINTLNTRITELENLEPSIIPASWFRQQIAQMEGNFHAFAKGPNEALFNEVNRKLTAQKETMPDYDEMKLELDARKELNGAYLMLESTQDNYVERIQPDGIDLRTNQIEFLFKYQKVADGWRLMDKIVRGELINELPGVDASTFVSNRDKILKYISERTDGVSAGIAYRLYRALMRASELDLLQKATIKDQFRELFHFLEFRIKYADKKAERGPAVTLFGQFCYSDKVPEFKAKGFNPILAVPSIKRRMELNDPYWDLFPGFFHFAYEGEATTSTTDGVTYTRILSENLDAKGNIIDFASYKDAEGNLRLEDMPWDKIPEDTYMIWLRQMKNTAHYLKETMLKTSYTVGELKNPTTYQKLTNTWGYIYPYLFGLRDVENQAALDKKYHTPETAKAVKQAKAAEIELRYMWLLGVIYENYAAAQLSVAWKNDDISEILQVATSSEVHFITHEQASRIKNALPVFRRIGEEALLQAAHSLKKEFSNV